MFFEYVSYFSPQVPITISETIFPLLTVSFSTPASILSSLVQSIETQDPPAIKQVRDFRYVYSIAQRFLASEPFPANPSSVDDPPLPSVSPTDLDIPIAL